MNIQEGLDKLQKAYPGITVCIIGEAWRFGTGTIENNIKVFVVDTTAEVYSGATVEEAVACAIAASPTKKPADIEDMNALVTDIEATKQE